MSVEELTRDELIEVKQRYLMELNELGKTQEVSWDSLACADELVSDETIFEYYSEVDFVPDDFCCNTGNSEEVAPTTLYMAQMLSDTYAWSAFGETENAAKEALPNEYNSSFGFENDPIKDITELDYEVEILPCTAGACYLAEI